MDIDTVADIHLEMWHAREYVDYALRQLADGGEQEDVAELERLRDALNAMAEKYGQKMRQWEAE